jgi:hypothetical protein
VVTECILKIGCFPNKVNKYRFHLIAVTTTERRGQTQVSKSNDKIEEKASPDHGAASPTAAEGA